MKMELVYVWFILPSAFSLDLVLGDPLRLPHPIRLMGRWIQKWEPSFRISAIGLTLSGCMFAICLVAGTLLSACLILYIAKSLNLYLYIICQIVIVYYSISVKSLRSAGMEIYRDLKEGSLEGARYKLSRIVGRDVNSLDSQGTARGAVESIGENLVDGVISPLFYAAIGGAPLCIAYKMINTLDSMIGYRNERYEKFGKCAARIDDIANFIPARLSVPIITVAAFILGHRPRKNSFSVPKQAGNHSSPNAGFPETAFSMALKIKLGGPNYYEGRLVEKPFIGPEFPDPSAEHIRQACNLMLLSSFIFFLPSWLYSITMGVFI